MSRWFRAAKPAVPLMVAEEEERSLRIVEEALLKLLNDEVAEANELLTTGESSYYYLGRGISSFIASMLGAEKDLLKDAVTKLQLAEKKTWDAMKLAEREPTAFRSEIYPPGTEYMLAYAIAQLTSAIAGVLTGSISEAIKGFYKLRKAYLTLDGIVAAESKYLLKYTTDTRSSTATTPSRKSTSSIRRSAPEEDLITTDKAAELVSKSDVDEKEDVLDELASENPPPMLTNAKYDEIDLSPAMSAEIFKDHTDVYIHSGTRLCYGLLLIVFSMIESPVFNKILYIVGIKGDRDRGTKFLWQATRFANFNSAIAGIALLGYYNGLIGFCDILPTDPGAQDDLAAYPREKCQALLAEMRGRYPGSHLWKMEEARTYSLGRNLPMALDILTENAKSNMKQIAIINMFEKALVSMCILDYDVCAKTWLECGELSTWSPTLYNYMAGCAYIELYRNNRLSDPTAAKKYKDCAAEHIRKGPPLAGKQKVMSKQLPFDIYIVRKVEKWEERAKLWDVELPDAIGTSPLAEMVYLWNGNKKQSPVELNKTLTLLEHDRLSEPQKCEDDFDEMAIEAVLRAAVSKNLGDAEEAKKILQEKVLSHDKSLFKGHNRDDWTCPSAHYEMACLAWIEKDLDGADQGGKVDECEKWLTQTRDWESYVLDSRMSFKVNTAMATLRRHRLVCGL